MPDPTKAEKLKVNDHDFDRGSAELVVQLSCQFGAATAGEHADFKVGATMVVKAGDKTYDLSGERNIQKVAGAVKDENNFIAIEPLRIGWADGATFNGTANVATTAFLTGPSGKIMGSEVKATEDIPMGERG